MLPVRPEMHVKTVTLSGRTEADNRATAVARTTGSIVSLKVRRGSQVNQGDVLAVLSDEAREAQVAEAAAMVRKRQTDLDSKLVLIKRGIIAANDKNSASRRSVQGSMPSWLWRRPSASTAPFAPRSPVSSAPCR